ncbi:Callose synthase 10 [Capsicum annuum]|nr:Callose synthase 10 [Capsicum annuum]
MCSWMWVRCDLMSEIGCFAEVCEQAYSMAQNLDPNSDGRGVLQFKTGLMSVIKQKLAKKEGARIDRNRDIERLWEFYQQYKRRHKVDDIRREEQKWRESGAVTANLGELGLRFSEMRKVFATLRAVVEVMESLSKDAPPDGVGRLITEELRRIKKSDTTLSAELAPYNIVPLEAPSLTNAIGFFPEVQGAISAIKYTEQFPQLPAVFDNSGQRDMDMFDLLEYVFGFQKDNIRNQRENVILIVANAQSGLGIPVEADPKIDENVITEVFLKVLDNYIKWCRYLRIRLVWNKLEAINRDRKLFLVSLYFCIWGEAANVRFLPECICYIFHHTASVNLKHDRLMSYDLFKIYSNVNAAIHGKTQDWIAAGMARELDAILDRGEASPAPSCIGENQSVSFLEQIICPIYETIAAEAARNNNGKAAHSKWRNYDDFNEYFWSPACFELGWPFKKESSFLRKPPKKGRRTGKSTFVEHRTFLHLYRSFHRLWIFLVVMFQALTIIAFSNEKINLDTFKKLLSVGPTFAVMNFIESSLDVLLMFGAYSTARGMAISRIVIRFFWTGVSSAFVIYVYLKLLEERDTNKDFYFRLYILVLGVYAGIRIVFALLTKLPACHTLSEMSDQSFFQFFKWIYQIKPLVGPTKMIRRMPALPYSWHDFISKNNNHILTIVSLWAPVVAIYLMDIHIWYTLLSAIVGGVMGARARLGEIRSIEMVHKRFESFPEAFVKNLVSPQTKRTPIDRQLSEGIGGGMEKSMAKKVTYAKLMKCSDEANLTNKKIYKAGKDMLILWETPGYCRRIKVEMVKRAISRLSKGRAARSDEIPVEIWKHLQEAIHLLRTLVEKYRKGKRDLHMVFIDLEKAYDETSQDNNKVYAALFSPFWNEIIKSLREEDYVSNREMDLLSMPSNTGSLRLVQWPLFLLCSKILLAIDLALDCKDTQGDLWTRISRDEYMAYAVQECYYSIEKILYSLVDGEGRLWVERIYREINNSIMEGSLVITLSLKKLPVVLSRFTALTGLLDFIVKARLLCNFQIGLSGLSVTPGNAFSTCSKPATLPFS